MNRKFAFFLRETALLCKSISWNRRSHELLKLIAVYYKVNVKQESHSKIPIPLYQSNEQNLYKGSRRSALFGNGKQWVEIQSAVFDSLIEVALEMKGM